MKLIDTRGHVCPMPLILLKKELSVMERPTDFQVFTDNEISKTNLLSYLKDNGMQATCEQADDCWILRVGDTAYRTDAIQTPLPHSSKSQTGNTIVVVKSDKMGIGNDELGEILIKGFFNALSEIDKPPTKVIFYNAGVLLCKEDSAVLQSLAKIAEKGTTLICCGACVDYFSIKENIKIASISNMLSICEMLADADKIIYP